MMLIDEGLELLDEAQCQVLLREGTIGRVGTTVGALPVILPVNYGYVDGDIVFCTGEGTKLRASRGGAVIAFEVDSYDIVDRRGWSVLAVGRAEVVTDESERSALQELGIAPWADGNRSSFVRLRPEMLTGRRIVG
ncbi:MAG TPA: pyridoxamine 5'-phosphate oxidase family protein [Acidimicrobiia bacterium]|nr:pyridoxamine 5'-phosphate oxidase family protein [Acidimicrobiia bacterium]